MKITILFPGQGSQKIGMGQDLYDQDSVSKELFSLANTVLGKDLASTCFEGPEDALKETQNAQPGIFLVSACLFELLKKYGITPHRVMGHSLGELTAYYAAGVLDFETTLKVIQARGAAMAKACPTGTSGMAAVIGSDIETISRVVSPYQSAPVVIANINAPNQVVISGERQALEKAITALKEDGVKRVIPLPVSGAFHSPLMDAAHVELKTFLEGISFNSATVPVVLNRSAAACTEASELKENLPLQVISSVRWVEAIQSTHSDTDVYIECGPGKVLTGLNKKILPEAQCFSVHSLEDIKVIEETLKEVLAR